MPYFIDRRLNPKGKSLANRQRFLRRARAQIREAVQKSLKDSSVADISKERKVKISTKGTREPRFRLDPKAAGERDFVLPGNREFLPGDEIKKPKAGDGGGRGKEAADSGEGEDDFAATLSLVRDIGFAQSFSFKYSRRPGTPAALMHEQVAEPVKAARLERLQALLAEQQRHFNAGMVGRVLPVLFEKRGRHDGQLAGRSPFLQPVHAMAPANLVGCIAPVEILSVRTNSLAGAVLSEAAA